MKGDISMKLVGIIFLVVILVVMLAILAAVYFEIIPLNEILLAMMGPFVGILS